MHPWNPSSAATMYGLPEPADRNTWLLGRSPQYGADFGSESKPRSLAPLFRYPGGKRAEIKYYAHFIPQRGDFNFTWNPAAGRPTGWLALTGEELFLTAFNLRRAHRQSSVLPGACSFSALSPLSTLAKSLKKPLCPTHCKMLGRKIYMNI